MMRTRWNNDLTKKEKKGAVSEARVVLGEEGAAGCPGGVWLRPRTI